jgi:CHAT domain-containing protein
MPPPGLATNSMTRHAAPAGIGILLTALLAAVPPDVRAQEATPLDARQTVERQITRHEAHRYRLMLAAGEFVSVIVEQQGIDVSVETRDPGDAVIAVFQQEIRGRGEEPVEVVAGRTGSYTLVVTAQPGVAAGAYTVRLADRRAANDVDRTMQEARRQGTAALALESAAQFAEARTLFERALALSEAARGPDSIFSSLMVLHLAGNALETRDDARSTTLYLRAVAMLDKAWGAEHPYPAIARSRLALLQQRAGQGPSAEAMLRPAMETVERTLGAEHPWFALCLMTQANLRDEAGDLDQAESIGRRALAILEAIDDVETNHYAALLNNLGDIARQRRDYTRAETLFLRALALTEKLEGPDSFHVSTDCQNLGIIARERKDYARAVAYYTRALSIRERLLGADHPDVAPILNNLANVQRATGDVSGALQTHFRALRIWEATRGPWNRAALNSVGNIARTYASIGDIAQAIAFQRRADAIIERQLDLNLAVGSERQKLAFAGSIAERTDRTVSLSLNEAAGNADASALAALVLLQRKGRVLDAMTETVASVRQRVSAPGDRALLDERNTLTTQLARLALNPPDEDRAGDRQQRVNELEARRERIEAALSEHSAELRSRMLPVTLDAVQAAIPAGAVLLELTVFRPFDPKAERNAEAYRSAHYGAFIIGRTGAPRGFDLGPAEAIDRAIDVLRQALRDPARADLRQRARALDVLVMQPLRAAFGDATRVLISPDGALNLVPFEALVDERGRYLIERYAISYLTSGRDLLRMQVARVALSPPVIVADPLFGEPSATADATRSARPANGAPRSITSADELATMYFAPIGGTAEEARAIKALFPEATLLTGRLATRAAVAQLQAPRLLHIASHGFFLRDTGAGPVATGTQTNGATPSVQNPLLRSGLALAGANLTKEGRDGGILTALEASGLNLWGTKLVTLSACDTGIGEVRNGEGVYGLRRAFMLAGAETLVMTLWPVSDYITREPMAVYYAGLRAGLGRGEALRQAKLAMLRRRNRQHPFYWASFIQSGEWASLDGVRDAHPPTH